MEPRLELVPTLGLTRRYTVQRDGQDVAQFSLKSLRDSGQLRIGGVPHDLHCKGDALRPLETYTLSHEGARMVRARKSTVLSNAFEIQLDDLVLTLIRRGRRCVVLAQGKRIGFIAPRHALRRRSDIDLPDDLTLPVKVFVAVLVTLLRSRPESDRSPFDVFDVVDLFD